MGFLGSHPMWVRGLKRFTPRLLSEKNVAPYVGAWIETIEILKNDASGESHPMWVRGLKQ